MATQGRTSQRSGERSAGYADEASEADTTGTAKAGGSGDAPPPPPTMPSTPVADDGDDPRRVAHELVAQAHAVLVIAHRDDVLAYWCPADLRIAVQDARAPLWIAIGDMQAAIAGGMFDEDLMRGGIGGPLSRPKRKGLRMALERLRQALGSKRVQSIRKWLKSAAGFARTAVGSMVREIPGGEVVAEALDGVLSGLDTMEALETTSQG